MHWQSTKRAVTNAAYVLGVCVLLYAGTGRTVKRDAHKQTPSVYAVSTAEQLAPTALLQPKDPAVLAFTREPLRHACAASEDYVRPAWELFSIAAFAFAYLMVQFPTVVAYW